MPNRRVGKGKSRRAAATTKASLQPPLLEWMAKNGADPQLQSPLLSLPWELRAHILTYVLGNGVGVVRGTCRPQRVTWDNDGHTAGNESKKKKKFLKQPGEAGKFGDVCKQKMWMFRPLKSDQWCCGDKATPAGETVLRGRGKWSNVKEERRWEQVSLARLDGIMGLLLVCRLMHFDIITHLRSTPFVFSDLTVLADFLTHDLLPPFPAHILRRIRIEPGSGGRGCQKQGQHFGYHTAYLYSRIPRRLRTNDSNDYYYLRSYGNNNNNSNSILEYRRRVHGILSYYQHTCEVAQREIDRWEGLWKAIFGNLAPSAIEEVKVCFHHRNCRTREWAFVNERKLLAPLARVQKLLPRPGRDRRRAALGSVPGKGELGLLEKITVCLPSLREDLKDPGMHYLDDDDKYMPKDRNGDAGEKSPRPRRSQQESKPPWKVVRCGRGERTRWLDSDMVDANADAESEMIPDLPGFFNFTQVWNDSDSHSASESESDQEQDENEYEGDLEADLEAGLDEHADGSSISGSVGSNAAWSTTSMYGGSSIEGEDDEDGEDGPTWGSGEEEEQDENYDAEDDDNYDSDIECPHDLFKLDKNGVICG